MVAGETTLRATARAIYDTCYPSDDWVPIGFDEAERTQTVHYRQAIDAARTARSILTSSATQAAVPSI